MRADRRKGIWENILLVRPKLHDMTLRNVTSPKRQVTFMIRLPTSFPPDRPPKPFFFACDEVSLNRPCPMARKKSAPARPSTGNRRNPLLQQAIIDADNEGRAKE